MTSPTPLNPYRHLASVVRSQIRLEQAFGADDRARLSWMQMAEFGATRFLVGKGGTNTFFWQVNGGERRVGYPNDLLALLDRLGRQAHVEYCVFEGGDRPMRTFLLASSALKTEPRRGMFIEGCPVGCGDSERVYEARRSVSGRMTWMRAGRG